MKKIISIIYLVTFGGVIGLLSGCATIIDGPHQRIQVLTSPTNSATCSVSNDKGNWTIDKTPGYVVVHRSSSDLVVACQKAGYQNAQTHVMASVNKKTFGNVLFGGIIGIGIDAADDAIDNYPPTINVFMKPLIH